MPMANVYTFGGDGLTSDRACVQFFSKVAISVQRSHFVVALYVT